MNESDELPTTKALPRKVIRRNRFLLLGLVVLSMLPLGGALWLYYGTPGMVAGAQTNRGALLHPPADLEALALRAGDGSVLTPDERRRWRVLVFPGQDCPDACMESLDLLRQVHILLGRDDDRVLRFAVLTDAAGPALGRELRTRWPEMGQVSAEAGLLARLLGERELHGREVPDFAGGAPDSGVLTVDPLGNVILYHGLEQIGPDLLSDLKQLLRLSNIG